jgi:hypothetical protein
MNRPASLIHALLTLSLLGIARPGLGDERQRPVENSPPDGAVVKSAVRGDEKAENLLKPGSWQPLERGFRREGTTFVCDNGPGEAARRGLIQRVELNQQEPIPFAASAWSKAEGVSGSIDSDYSVYIDLTYIDGSELWGQAAGFRTGSHDWQREEVMVFPEKPVRSVAFNLLLREHAGKAWFRDPALRIMAAPHGSVVFDGVPVTARGPALEGFQVRDVAAGGDFVRLQGEALGLRLEVKRDEREGATFFDVTVRDTTGKDRAVTLLYAIPVATLGVRWLDDPRRSRPVEGRREFVHAATFRAGVNGRLSIYPLGAVTRPGERGEEGLALGIDMAQPAFYRIGYNAGTGEFWIAYDLGLVRENPVAKLRCCRFAFEPSRGFRGALAGYYRLFPEAFQRRIADQGLWMPFARISRVKGWEDFGFRFKEGNDEIAWDDAHDIITFRYTEPLTWWMPMPRTMPRTIEAATSEAQRLAARGKPEARALLSSGYHNADGTFAALFRDEPWNHGAVWSMNSMPGIPGDVTDFSTKWNGTLRERLYGPARKGDLDGEYIDSSEGYVTDELDFRRDHFAAARTPLTFSLGTHRPALFRGLIAFEYVRSIAADMHGTGKLMMANATPDRLCWLAPLLDVMGTEIDWNPGGRWRPMSDADMIYRRALCKGKPYCFLMNTDFDRFPSALVEKYMKRSLAYGFFPGFFSHNASEGHYFSRPALYDRDRGLFRKYVPLCKLVAEAGWEPITAARASDEHVRLERFGAGATSYLTVLNDSPARRSVTIELENGDRAPKTIRELTSGRPAPWSGGKTQIQLEGEDVAVLELTR